MEMFHTDMVLREERNEIEVEAPDPLTQVTGSQSYSAQAQDTLKLGITLALSRVCELSSVPPQFTHTLSHITLSRPILLQG